MRELYFRPFEIAVKDGGTRAVMSSFNRIGTVWTGGSYELLTEVLRDEWGFEGMVITDYNYATPYMDPDPDDTRGRRPQPHAEVVAGHREHAHTGHKFKAGNKEHSLHGCKQQRHEWLWLWRRV